jgi:FtsZ-binding cell division protein ZapB|tara:strand:- start:1178 stop:1351 length:174 start_codon:yes stop_codon:yes gene_type:complete
MNNTLNAEIQGLKEENEILRTEVNLLRNELTQYKKQLREIIGDDIIRKNGFLAEENT